MPSMKFLSPTFRSLLVAFAVLALAPLGLHAQAPADGPHEYQIAIGDVVHVSVFQSADLTLDARVQDDGAISYPLLGTVNISGLSVSGAEQLIAKRLRDGGFMVAPHVTVTLVQVRGNQVTVLGQVSKPGRLPLDSSNSRLTEVLALAGGINATGSETVVVSGMRMGKPLHLEVDIRRLATRPDGRTDDLFLENGDLVYVPAAPLYYIYGEVQKPGAYRVESGMTVMQALAMGGGLTPKGTQRGLTLHRRDAKGAIEVTEPKLDDEIRTNDVIYIREGLF